MTLEYNDIITLAKSLGLDTQGENPDEILANIAGQLGLTSIDPSVILNRLHSLQEDTVPKVQHGSINQSSRMSSPKLNPFSIQRQNTTNAFDRINQNRRINHYNRQAAEENSHISEQSQGENAEKQKEKKTGSIRDKAEDKLLQMAGVPKTLREPILKRKSESNNGIPNITSSILGVKGVMTYSLVVIGIIMVIIILFAISFSAEEDESLLNHSKTLHGFIVDPKADFDDLSEELVHMNICRENEDKTVQKEECQNSNAGKFLIHVNELYNDYKKYKDIDGNDLQLDTTLLLDTISYSRTDGDLFDDKTFDEIYAELDELAEALVEEYQEVGDLFYLQKYYELEGGKQVERERCVVKQDQVYVGAGGESIYYRNSDDKFVSYLKYGRVHENYTTGTKVYDVDIHPDSDSKCIPSGRSYKPSSVTRYVGH